MASAPQTGVSPVRLVGSTPVLYRIYRPFDDQGNAGQPWHFSSIGHPLSGCFDLPEPHGTCYASDTKSGAWLAVFRDLPVVPRPDVERRRMLTVTRTGSPVLFADVTAKQLAHHCASFSDLTDDNDLPAPQCAAEFRAAGFDGVVGWTHHDPSTHTRDYALFGVTGPRSLVRGWGTRSVNLLHDRELLDVPALIGAGTAIAPIPYDIPTVKPR